MRAPSPSSTTAHGPNRSMPASCTRCSCSTPMSLRTLASGPGTAAPPAPAPERPVAPIARRVVRSPITAMACDVTTRDATRSRTRSSCRAPARSASSRTASTPGPNDDPDAMDTRSFSSVVRAHRHPSSTVPTT